MNLSGSTLIHAYGRDSKTKSETLSYFVGGMDFQLVSPFGCGYISVRDFAPGDRVTIRYKGLRNVLSYVVTGKECAS